jgi:hypothetical protein
MSLTFASFFLSTIISKSEQARNLGFFLFIVFFIGAKGLVAGYFNDDSHSSEQIGLSFVLPIPFFQSLTYLIKESSGNDKYGLTWRYASFVSVNNIAPVSFLRAY